jgi:ribosomal protein S27AE
VQTKSTRRDVRYGANLAAPVWHKRLVCGQCGSRQIDFVVTGAKP